MKDVRTGEGCPTRRQRLLECVSDEGRPEGSKIMIFCRRHSWMAPMAGSGSSSGEREKGDSDWESEGRDSVGEGGREGHAQWTNWRVGREGIPAA